MSYPRDRVADALAGDWRWIVTPRRVVGATTYLLNINTELAIPAGAKFIDLNSDL